MAYRIRIVLTFVYLVIICQIAQCADVFPGHRWEEASPESAGYSASKLQAAGNYFKELGSNAAMVVVNGKVIASWGDVSKRVMMHSVRKSFISALYGITAERGLVDLKQTLGGLGIDDLPPSLTTREKRARIIDLLSARSGVYHPAAAETAAMKAGRPARGSHAPGTFWYYNNWDFNVLGTILEMATKTKVFDLFYKNIATPLHMEDFALTMNRYQRESSSRFAAYNFYMSARDMARFGLMFLHDGNWAGTQIVPAAWVKESTARHSNAGTGIGYGYLWWTSEEYHLGAHVGSYAYSARGVGGQFIIVVPALHLVLVHNCDDGNGQPDTYSKVGKLLGLVLDARSN